ncbi:uncharacterized protein VTP21DRAFT_235 [Calcarisporiella thermophila]|uniref:uncharacterized protein n=1 Tax=Calcarisporiella thermophila TaxID=911321 RepID=UPI00374479B8
MFRRAPKKATSAPSSTTTSSQHSLAAVGDLSSVDLPRFLQGLQSADQGAWRRLVEKYKHLNSIEDERAAHANDPSFEYSMCAGLSDDRDRNRYADILPYDHSRVKLTPVGKNGDDYINASYVEAGATKYVTTQGPLDRTIPDFWQMVWETRSRVIVMLTREQEGSRGKCSRYWPVGDKSDKAFEFSKWGGKVSFVKQELDKRAECMVREFKLTRNGEERIIWQCHYLGWPDHGVPESPQGALELVALSRALRRRAPDAGPMIVHCAAGVGRSGTFCVIDTCLSRINEWMRAEKEEAPGEARDMIYEVVKRFREQRRSMVQTLPQYEYCYWTLFHALATSFDPEGREL